MGLGALVLAQALVSLAPTLENVRTLQPLDLSPAADCRPLACSGLIGRRTRG